MTETHKTLFPEIIVTETIPEGFEDVSWQHDEFPSWYNKEKDIKLYITDGVDGTKYQICNESDVVFESDFWAFVIEFINNYKI